MVCRLRDDYEAAVNGIRTRLLRYSEPNKLAYVGSYSSLSSTKSVRNEMVRFTLSFALALCFASCLVVRFKPV